MTLPTISNIIHVLFSHFPHMQVWISVEKRSEGNINEIPIVCPFCSSNDFDGRNCHQCWFDTDTSKDIWYTVSNMSGNINSQAISLLEEGNYFSYDLHDTNESKFHLWKSLYKYIKTGTNIWEESFNICFESRPDRWGTSQKYHIIWKYGFESSNILSISIENIQKRDGTNVNRWSIKETLTDVVKETLTDVVKYILTNTQWNKYASDLSIKLV